MPRFAITAIVTSERIFVNMAVRQLRKELRRTKNVRFLTLEDIEIVELKEVEKR